MIGWWVTCVWAVPGDPWAAETAAALAAAPPDTRLDLLATWVAAESDPGRRQALIAIGRLRGALAADPETVEVYTRSMLEADDAAGRSYVAAAAGFGAVLGMDGAPTMGADQALALYAARRAAVDWVAWRLCWTSQRVDEKGRTAPEWKGGPLGEDVRARAVTHRDFVDDCYTATGWSLWRGDEVVTRAADLPDAVGTRTCEPPRVRISQGFPTVGPNGTIRPGSSRYVTPDPRPEDCWTVAEVGALVPALNEVLRTDLKLTADQVAHVPPPPSAEPRECQRPNPRWAERCRALAASP